jgi:ATP-dependent RNA helicase DeaD
MTFEETGLHENLVRATEELGFKEPTPIQEKIIPAILSKETDLIALAQTGTGKTAAFGLPLIHLADLDNGKVQAIVLCPTRELCMQITGDMKKFSKFSPGFKTVAVYGGADIKTQITALRNGCQVVVGTPGRVMDLINRKVLRLDAIKWLVLDEADEMLNMGFKDDLDVILADTPKEKRTLLFSATMPPEIAHIARKYMNKPEEIAVGKHQQGADNIRHEYYTVQAKDRYAALKRIVDIYPNVYGIVFCRTRQITKDVADKLMNDGYNADTLHGDLSQTQRDYVMNRFRIRQLQLLVATDVAARGLDVNDLTHVINYDLPDDNEVYIHRIGRTARAGKSGVAISIIHSRESGKMRAIEKLLNKRFDQKKIPTGVEICEKQLFNLVDKVENVEVDETQIEPFLPVILKKLDWLSREDLIKHFVSVEFNRILAYYKNTNDLNVPQPEHEKKRRQKSDFVTFKINVGFQDGINPPRLIGLINEQTRNRNIEVGKIEIEHGISFFEIEKDYQELILKSFGDAIFEGVKVTVKLADHEPRGRSKDKPDFKSKSRSGKDKPDFKSKNRSEKKDTGKAKAWSGELSDSWAKDKKKGKKKEWESEKPAGKKKNKSPFKKW